MFPPRAAGLTAQDCVPQAGLGRVGVTAALLPLASAHQLGLHHAQEMEAPGGQGCSGVGCDGTAGLCPCCYLSVLRENRAGKGQDLLRTRTYSWTQE